VARYLTISITNNTRLFSLLEFVSGVISINNLVLSLTPSSLSAVLPSSPAFNSFLTASTEMSSGTSASNLLHNQPPDERPATSDRYSQQRPDQPRSAPSHLASAPGTPSFPSHTPQPARSKIHDLLSSEPHPTSSRQSPSLQPTSCTTTTGPPHKRLKASPDRDVRPGLSTRYSHDSGSQAYALASLSEGTLGRPRQSPSDESLESDSSPQRSQHGHAEDEPDFHAGNTAPTLQKQRKRYVDFAIRCCIESVLPDVSNQLIQNARVFSNRTKTGCMTCRERKKKCDEKKPDCQNCTKGGQ